jgi:hypothetical protein
VVTRCGESEGYAYFEAGSLVPKNKAGWAKDKTTGGSYLLLREGDNFDIVYTDATKRTISSREDRGQIIRISESGGNYVILVNYPAKLVETWVFELDGDGGGVVAFHQARYDNHFPIRKHSVMRASCEK